jgi:hypothetical protein
MDIQVKSTEAGVAQLDVGHHRHQTVPVIFLSQGWFESTSEPILK